MTNQPLTIKLPSWEELGFTKVQAQQIHKAFEEYRKEVLKYLKIDRWRKTRYGYRRKGEIGTATNADNCLGFNQAVSELNAKTKKLKR